MEIFSSIIVMVVFDSSSLLCSFQKRVCILAVKFCSACYFWVIPARCAETTLILGHVITQHYSQKRSFSVKYLIINRSKNTQAVSLETCPCPHFSLMSILSLNQTQQAPVGMMFSINVACVDHWCNTEITCDDRCSVALFI